MRMNQFVYYNSSQLQLQPIKHMIATYVNDSHDDWDTYLPFVQMAHNSSRHTVIGATPSMLLYGREMRIPIEILVPSQGPPETDEGDYISDLRTRLSDVWQTAREKIDQGRLKLAARRAKQVHTLNIKIGDAVLYREKQGAVGRARKLLPRWTGPWNVLRVTDTNAQIQLISKPDSNPKWAHLEALKPYLDNFVQWSDALARMLPFKECDTDSEWSSQTESSVEESEKEDTDSDGLESGDISRPLALWTNGTVKRVSNNSEKGSRHAECERESECEESECAGQGSQQSKGPNIVNPPDGNVALNANQRYSTRKRKTTRKPDFVYSS